MYLQLLRLCCDHVGCDEREKESVEEEEEEVEDPPYGPFVTYEGQDGWVGQQDAMFVLDLEIYTVHS